MDRKPAFAEFAVSTDANVKCDNSLTENCKDEISLKLSEKTWDKVELFLSSQITKNTFLTKLMLFIGQD